ncbi:B2 bradykinin receptor-like [Sander lucioperca]|uniref:B2 bradykinin receptor n=1 Tax=Sander lucioperca TaxID=283035 RepID=A0A8D0D5U7_SANLU|nr:B2 bradykinin receptor-like [Sander lucioperca]
MTLQPSSIPDLSTTALYRDQNNTNGSDCPDLYDWEWLHTSQPVYILLITVLGIVFNVFVLIVFCFHKKACTVAEIYLSNLAAADLVLVSCLPFWAVYTSNGFHWTFGLFLCKVVNLGIKMNAYSSIYFLVLVSIDRYVALVHTMSHGRMRRPKYAKLGCLLMWGFGLVLSIPVLIFRQVRYFPEYGVNACFLDYPTHTVELFSDGMLIVFSFIIPISIISFCTVKIIQALKIQAIERFNAVKTERKATTLMLTVLLAFLICWVPFHVVTTLDLLLRAEVLGGCHLLSVIDICNQIFTYLAFFNSVLNPILYVLVGKNFRKKVCELFKQWSIRKIVTSESSRSSNLSSTLKTLV